MFGGSTGNPPEACYRLMINRRRDWLHRLRCTIWRFEFGYEECVDMEETTRGSEFCIIATHCYFLDNMDSLFSMLDNKRD